MAFQFNPNANVAKAREGKGVDTGVHKAKITKTLMYQTEKGNNLLDVFFETETGSQFAVYQMCIDEKWASGAENYDYSTFMELALSAGMKTGETYETEREITKNNEKVKEKCLAFKELEGKTVFVAVYWELDVYNNKEKKSRKIQRTFNSAGLSVAEVEQGKTEAKTKAKVEDRIEDYQTKAHKEWTANGAANSGDTAVDTSDAGSSQVQNDEDII